MEQLEKYLHALLLVELDTLRESDARENTSLLLARAGFDSPEVAGLLNKKVATVQKAAQRARQTRRRNTK